MYNQPLHHQINHEISLLGFDLADKDNNFYARLIANSAAIFSLYNSLYQGHPSGSGCFNRLIQLICSTYSNRSKDLKARDYEKLEESFWYTSNKMAGMSLYVDRFCGDLQKLESRLDYFRELGVNLLHLMPLFESPAGESDGGYAVSDFRKVDGKFGTLQDLKRLQEKMMGDDMYLMLDIVLNHTSHQHEWAQKAMAGDPFYQAFFYTYSDRAQPDAFEAGMPEVFPESAPGSFTWNEAMQKWVMTVFHQYQWDLNFSNPEVLLAMMDNIFFYANLGVDVLRIDAPAFIWKKVGTTCQNLPEAHTLLRLIRQCVEVATPGMALLGEAIVAPEFIIPYFGTGRFTGLECHFAYNATQMALQWDALATTDTRIMLSAQPLLQQKPLGASWINYIRCHDDIGLGYSDEMIRSAGFEPFEHRKFIKDYYSGNYQGSTATGALFGSNPKTMDARISGSLASLCGLESALVKMDSEAESLAIKKIILMQAHSLFLGGLPMLYYGDEVGYLNDYSYMDDPSKSYDNRWMHRPVINWKKNDQRLQKGTVEFTLFNAIKQILALRKSLPEMIDKNNISWLYPFNIHVSGYARFSTSRKLFCLFNFSDQHAWLRLEAFELNNQDQPAFYDHYSMKNIKPNKTDSPDFIIIGPYDFMILEEK